jgi:sugar phosphate permease
LISAGQSNSRPLSYWSSRVFNAAWIGYAGFYFCRRNISWTPLPLNMHRGWLNGLADLIVVFSAGYIAGQIVGGWAADRFGARRTILAGGILSVLATLLLVTHIPLTLVMLLQCANGFGQGFGWPATMKILRIWLPRRQFAIGVAWWSTSYALGSFLASALATALSTADSMSIASGSRLAVLVPCGVLALSTLFFYVRVKDVPSEVASDLPSRNDFGGKLGWANLLRNTEIQLLAAMYFFLKLTRYALLFWLPIYIIETQHSKGNSAVALSSLFELTGFLGAVAASYASERWFQGRRYPVGACMLFLAAFVFLMHPLVSSWGTWPAGISIACIGMLIFGPDVLMASVAVVEAVPDELVGRAAGYVNGIGSIGQMLSPAVVAYATHVFGWTSIFTIFVVCSLISGSLLAIRWNEISNGPFKWPAAVPNNQ